MQLTLQATVWDCLAFDPFAFGEDCLSPSEVDVSRREIGQALVIEVKASICWKSAVGMTVPAT